MSYLPPFWFQQFRDALGNPLSNGTLETYENLSSIPKPVYTDHELLYPHTNPVLLDSYGFLPSIFLTSGYYTFTLKDRFGIVIKTADWIEGSLGANTEIGSSYTLSAATASTLGGIKVGNGLAIDGSGVLSVTATTSATQISLSAYATLSGSNFTGPVTSPTFSANSISGNAFETSSVKVSDINGGLKLENKSGSYDVKLNFGPDNSNQFIKTESGQMRIGGENAYASFNGANFYITSGSLIVGDDPATMGTKSLINNQQLTQNYRATFNSSAFILDKFRSKQLITDSSGQLSGYDVGGVAYDTGDIPRPLKYKIKNGAGIILTTATDASNGVVMSINARGNNWALTKYITASSYTVTDSDSMIVINAASSTITLPSPSNLYDGRIVEVQNAVLGGSCTINSLGTIVGESTTITNYQRRSLVCVYNGSSWIWICR